MPTVVVDPEGLNGNPGPGGAGGMLNPKYAREVAETVKDLGQMAGGGGKQAANAAAKKLIDKMKTKAVDWIAKNKKGSINKEFPSEWGNKTLEEIRKAAQNGEKNAKKAWKLLNDNRFNKTGCEP